MGLLKWCLEKAGWHLPNGNSFVGLTVVQKSFPVVKSEKPPDALQASSEEDIFVNLKLEGGGLRLVLEEGATRLCEDQETGIQLRLSPRGSFCCIGTQPRGFGDSIEIGYRFSAVRCFGKILLKRDSLAPREVPQADEP